MSGSKPLIYNQWYHTYASNLNNKKFLSVTFKVSDMEDLVDLNNMTGVDFMKTAVKWLSKQFVEMNMIPGYITGYTTVDGETNKGISTHFRFQGEDLVIDSSGVVFYDFAWDYYWKSPGFKVLSDLALEMVWFKRKATPDDHDDARFDLDLVASPVQTSQTSTDTYREMTLVLLHQNESECELEVHQ